MDQVHSRAIATHKMSSRTVVYERTGVILTREDFLLDDDANSIMKGKFPQGVNVTKKIAVKMSIEQIWNIQNYTYARTH